MTKEESIQERLVNRFPYLEGKVKVQRVRRIFADVPIESFYELFRFTIDELKHSMLCAITGLDDGQVISIIYHMANEEGIVLNIRTSIPKDKPVLKTITRDFPSADIYERELKDLLGVQVEGLSEGKRYPLPDDWPAGEYPLRKDWKMPAKQNKEMDKDA